jgi:hypothetical protein
MSLTHWVKFKPKFYAQILHILLDGQSQQTIALAKS